MPHRSDHYASALGGLGGGLGRGWMLGMQMERQKLLQKQRTLSLRQADLKVRGELTEFFKENADPALLEAQFNEVMSSLPGEDINSPRNKQFKQTLLKMNDETKSRIGKMIMRIAPDLEPGELANFTVRFMKKELTVPGLMKIVKQTEGRATRERVSGVLTGPLDNGQTESARAAEAGKVALAGGDAPGARAAAALSGAFRAQPGERLPAAVQRKIAEANVQFGQRVGPRILDFLGQPTNIAQTRDTLATKGIFVPPPEVISELKSQEAQIQTANNVISNIVQTAENNERLFGLPAFIANSVTTLASNVKGLVQLIPEAADRIPGFEYLRTDLLELVGPLVKTSVEANKIRSAIVDLTFQGAALVGQTGRALSDKDYDNVTKQVAAGVKNPKVMIGVMRNFALLQNQAFNKRFKVETGTTKFVGMPKDFNARYPFRDLGPVELNGVIEELLDAELFTKYKLELQRRLDLVNTSHSPYMSGGFGAGAGGRVPGGVGIE
jgi:hypothetical protein